MRAVRRDTDGPAMESLTYCQATRTRVAVRTVRRDTVEPAMESLTYCQVNRTRVAVRAVRRDAAGPAMESLRTHILSSQQDQSGSEDSKKGHSWTCHQITHKLSHQQCQSIYNKITPITDLQWHPA